MSQCLTEAGHAAHMLDTAHQLYIRQDASFSVAQEL